MTSPGIRVGGIPALLIMNILETHKIVRYLQD